MSTKIPDHTVTPPRSKMLRSMRSDNALCPRCQSEDIEVEDPYVTDNDEKVLIFGHCCACKFEWTEAYSLVSVQEGISINESVSDARRSRSADQNTGSRRAATDTEITAQSDNAFAEEAQVHRGSSEDGAHSGRTGQAVEADRSHNRRYQGAI